MMIHEIADICCEILERTHDGDDLSPQHLSMIQWAANDQLNDAGITELKKLHAQVMGGVYKSPYHLGVEFMTYDHEGFIYFKGQQVGALQPMVGVLAGCESSIAAPPTRVPVPRTEEGKPAYFFFASVRLDDEGKICDGICGGAPESIGRIVRFRCDHIHSRQVCRRTFLATWAPHSDRNYGEHPL